LLWDPLDSGLLFYSRQPGFSFDFFLPRRTRLLLLSNSFTLKLRLTPPFRALGRRLSSLYRSTGCFNAPLGAIEPIAPGTGPFRPGSKSGRLFPYFFFTPHLLEPAEYSVQKRWGLGL
jgi:hypothetical protein